MKNTDYTTKKYEQDQDLETNTEQYDYRQISRKISDVHNNRNITLSDVDTYFIKTPYEIFAESAIGGRSENQDFYSAVETPYGLLLLVCDGMGGANGGATASRLAVKSIIERIETYANDATPKELLHSVIEYANTVVYNRSISEPQLSGMGTTIVALLLSDKKATVAHVGDSRLYQIRKNKKIFRTFDHSMVFELVRRGSITEEEARVSVGSNVILQALGTKPTVDNIEITDDISYIKGDRFLLCTDGVCGAVSESKVLELAMKEKSIKATVNNLITTINDIGVASGNEHANLTAILLEMKGKSCFKQKKRGKKLWLYIIVIIAIIAAISFASLMLFRDYKNNQTINTEDITNFYNYILSKVKNAYMTFSVPLGTMI